MPAIDLGIVRRDLENSSYHETNWISLGLPCDETVAQEVIETCQEELIWAFAEEGQMRVAHAVSPACERAARKLAKPAVEKLFSGHGFEEARLGWKLFGVNYYETGDDFPSHADFKTSERQTVLVLSLSGVRMLKVEDGAPIRLETGSITLLNGYKNPMHTAWCTEGPSVSVVADVPALL